MMNESDLKRHRLPLILVTYLMLEENKLLCYGMH
jgi:hypothetical protein